MGSPRAVLTGLFVVTGLLAASPAYAAEAACSSPTSTVESDGTVCVRVVLPATEAEVRQQIDTGSEVANLHSGTRIIAREQAGSCERLTYQTPGLTSPLTYVALRCPTATGWKQTLVSSDDFTTNESEWQLKAVEGGTELRYRVRVKLDGVPVGQSLVNSQVAQSMKQALQRLEARLSK